MLWYSQKRFVKLTKNIANELEPYSKELSSILILRQKLEETKTTCMLENRSRLVKLLTRFCLWQNRTMLPCASGRRTKSISLSIENFRPLNLSFKISCWKPNLLMSFELWGQFYDCVLFSEIRQFKCTYFHPQSKKQSD
jgi:hypothetical protein